jgi:hypothetical protein
MQTNGHAWDAPSPASVASKKSVLRCRFGEIAAFPAAERDELWFGRHPALAFCLSMIPRVTPEGMLFGKPDSTFPDHAPGNLSVTTQSGIG